MNITCKVTQTLILKNIKILIEAINHETNNNTHKVNHIICRSIAQISICRSKNINSQIEGKCDL